MARIVRVDLHEMVKARAAYEEGRKRLKTLGLDHGERTVCLYEAAKTIINKYFKELKTSLENFYSAGINVEMDFEGAFYSITDTKRELLSSADRTEEELLLDMDYCISEIDFKRIRSHLEKQIKLLPQRAVREVAETILEEFGLNEKRVVPQYEDKAVIYSMHSTSHHNKKTALDRLVRINNKLSLIGLFNDIDFGSAIINLHEQIEKIEPGERISTRKSFGKGSLIRIVCYKDEYKFYIDECAFEVIIAFTMLYGSPERKKLANTVLNELSELQDKAA